MKTRDKIHEFLQEKALNTAILKTVGDIGNYFIENGELKIWARYGKLIEFDIFNFIFPSWKEIREKAVKYYPGFDMQKIKKVKYYFVNLNLEKNLNISAKNSDVYLGKNEFIGVNIIDADNVTINDSPVIDGGISINAKNINLIRLNDSVKGDINLTSSCIEFQNISLLFANNINLNSNMIEFNKTYIFSYNIDLKSNLIVTEKSRLSAVNSINITDTNLDEIKGVEAPLIIYNGQDITHSDGIVIPKLRRNLIEVLQKARNKISAEIDNEIKKETKILKEELNSKPITKILKK